MKKISVSLLSFLSSFLYTEHASAIIISQWIKEGKLHVTAEGKLIKGPTSPEKIQSNISILSPLSLNQQKNEIQQLKEELERLKKSQVSSADENELRHLRSELEKLRRSPLSFVDQKEVERLKEELEGLKGSHMVPVDQNKLRRLKEKNRVLKLEVERLRALAQKDGSIKEPAPMAKKFMENYPKISIDQKNQEFNAAFVEIRDKQDVDTAYAVYDYLMNRFEQLSKKMDPTPEDIQEAEDILAKTAKMGEATGAFAQAVEKHAKEQEEKQIGVQIIEDQPFFEDVARDAAARVNNQQNPPMLLLFLLRNPTEVVKSPNLKKEHWRALGGYLEYLNVNQLRALRYHFQKDNNRANIPAGEDGDPIREFIQTATNRISSNAKPKPIRPFTKNSFRQYVGMINSILTPEEKLQKEIQTDSLAYQPVLIDVRKRENDLDNPPMLLLFLLKDPALIVKSQDISEVEWRRLEPFLSYLSIEELRALRYHFQKDDNKNNIPDNDIGKSIKQFIISIGAYIERGGHPTPLDKVGKSTFQRTYQPLIDNIR